MAGISTTASRWEEEGILFTEKNMKKFNGMIGEYISRAYEDDNIELYNLNEFRADYYDPQVRQSERLKGNEKAELARKASFQNRQQISNQVLERFGGLANKICVDSDDNPVIGEDYGVSAIQKVITNSTHFDILIAVNNQERRPPRNTKVASINKIDNLVGFIIAEYGECKMKPDVWSVNLICAGKAGNRGLKGIGNVLLGAFLYCIKNSNYKQEAVLELASGYTNIPGFLSYSKLGFNKDLSLYQLGRSGSSSFFGKTAALPSCFTDLGNLPMSVDLSTMTSDVIINRVTGDDLRVVTDIDDDTGLFNAAKSLPLREKQEVITYSNILYKIEASKNLTGPPPGLSKYELKIYNTLRIQLINAGQSENNANMVQLIKQDRNRVYQSLSSSPVPSPLPASPGSPFGSPPGSPPGSPTSSAPTKSGWVCTAERCVYVVGTGAGAVAGFMVGGPKLAPVGAAAGVFGANKLVKGTKKFFGYEGGKSKKKSKRTAKTRRRTKHR